MATSRTYTLAQAATSGIHTLEIAAALVTSLTTALNDKSISVVADGIADTPSPSGDEAKFPGVSIEVSEGMPVQHNSRRHRFGVRIDVTTLFQRDKTQANLYRISQKVRKWFATADITLNSSTFQALIAENRPRREDLDHYQTMEFDNACDALLPEDER